MKRHSFSAILMVLALLAPCFARAVGSSKFAVSKPTIDRGLLGYWTFDGKDMQNGAVRDMSDGGKSLNAGSVATSTFYAQGRVGQAVRFDGVNDELNRSNALSSAFNFTHATPFSVAMWVKPSNVTQSSYWANKRTTDANFAGWITFQTAAKLDFQVRRNSSERLVTDSTNNVLEANVWKHVVYTYDGTNSTAGMKMYVNGEAIAVTSTTNLALTGNPSNTADFKIGVRDDETSPYSGMMDDVRIYGRALSDLEVRQLYGLGSAKFAVSKPTVDLGLLGYWTFDGKDMANGVALDMSGSGNGGNLISVATSTVYAAGKSGQAVNLDGVNDSINAGDIAAVDNATALSGCAWLNHKSVTTDDPIFKKSPNNNTDGIFFWRDDVAGVSGRTDTYSIFIADSNSVSNARIESATGASPLRKWTHVCFTYAQNAATGLHLYVNGVEDANSPVSTVGITGINGGTNAFRIGSFSDGTTDWFDGKIDEARLYSRALTQTEVKQLYGVGAAKFR